MGLITHPNRPTPNTCLLPDSRPRCSPMTARVPHVPAGHWPHRRLCQARQPQAVSSRHPCMCPSLIRLHLTMHLQHSHHKVLTVLLPCHGRPHAAFTGPEKLCHTAGCLLPHSLNSSCAAFIYASTIHLARSPTMHELFHHHLAALDGLSRILWC